MGMVGGGEGAFIGEIHRAAARLDGAIRLVCGAFSSDAANSRRMGMLLGLPVERAYGDWQEMLASEAALPQADRMQFLAIVTPNDLHFPIAKGALELGFHVLSEKPATRNLEEALELAEIVSRTGLCYALAHTYLGYPMVVEARARVLRGALGRIRRVVVRYSQGWLSTALEAMGNRQALWRTDPARAGAAGSVGDIGVHAFTLAEYISGLKVTQLCADLGTAVSDRSVDDHASAFLRFENDANGLLEVSQISTGESNSIEIALYGETGGMVWSHRDPNSLRMLSYDGTMEVVFSGSNARQLDPAVRGLCRTPAGHPEGFIEAFANLYRLFTADISAGAVTAFARPSSPAPISTAVRGMTFIDAMLRSNSIGQRWVSIDDLPN